MLGAAVTLRTNSQAAEAKGSSKVENSDPSSIQLAGDDRSRGTRRCFCQQEENHLLQNVSLDVTFKEKVCEECILLGTRPLAVVLFFFP